MEELGENNRWKPKQYDALLDEFQTSNKQDTGKQRGTEEGLERIHKS